jgi:hypothetical protein
LLLFSLNIKYIIKRTVHIYNFIYIGPPYRCLTNVASRSVRERGRDGAIFILFQYLRTYQGQCGRFLNRGYQSPLNPPTRGYILAVLCETIDYKYYTICSHILYWHCIYNQWYKTYCAYHNVILLNYSIISYLGAISIKKKLEGAWFLYFPVTALNRCWMWYYKKNIWGC